MKLASEWRDELAACRRALSYNLYIMGYTLQAFWLQSIYGDKAKQKHQNRQNSGLLNDKARDFFNLQVNLPRTDLQKNSAQLWCEALEWPVELHTQQSPLRQETLGMGCVPVHLQFYYLNGSPIGRIKIPMVPGTLEDSTTCWTVLQSWL